jgi:mannose-6-phosphate isomerase-like protein (cupin superfamily)
MLKIVGHADVSSIAMLGRSNYKGDDHDFQREQVAADACVSVTSSHFDVDGVSGHELTAAFADLIRTTKRRFVDAGYDEAYACSESRDDGSLLVFQNVTKHRDVGFYLYRRGSEKERHNRLQATTFSIVLSGECTLHLHRRNRVESIRLQPGDIYVFEQTSVHSVTDSSEICVHLTTSIPKVVAKTLMPICQPSIQKIKQIEQQARNQG